MTNIIFVSNYAAAYGGNFLTSFKYLAECIKVGGVQTILYFPKSGREDTVGSRFK